MSVLSNMDWGNWLKGLWAAFIGGGSNAVVAGIGLNLADPSHFNTQTRQFYKLVLTLFAVNGTLAFFMYLKQNPLPVSVEDKTEAKKTEHEQLPGGGTKDTTTEVTRSVTTTIPPEEKQP